MKDFEKELRALRDKVQRAERRKVQLETIREEALKRKEELEEQSRALGVDPAKLNEHIKNMEIEIEDLLNQIKQFLPTCAPGDEDALFSEEDDDDAAF